MVRYRPYSVRTPPYEVTSGGIRVMYGLYGALLAKGQIVFLNATFDNPDFVAIYPEIYEGNDTMANTVVRYILAPPGEMASQGRPGPTEFPPTDRLYSFSKMIYNTDDRHTLFLPILNTHLFKDYGKKRTKRCVYFGKGTNTNVHPPDCLEINRTLATNQAGLADLLNECQVMYCYDHRTAMTEIARLCGCRVVVIPSRVSLQEFELYEPGMNGITWGIGSKAVNLDTGEFTKTYNGLKKIFDKKLDWFIEDTQR